MDCVSSKPRMNVEDDRLSILPDDVIHKILSFINIKHAIRTSSLSSRWRFLWTSIPYLNISTEDPEFVNRLLSHRNGETEVYSVKLSFDQTFSKPLLKRVLEYAFSHNVKQVTVSCLLREKIDFPLYLFRSRSLQYLRLTGSRYSFREGYSIILASSWELPSLTTLHLDYAAFYDDRVFSECANLKNLILNKFRILKGRCFTLCHPGLSDLTLNDNHWTTRPANVVAPQLKNLTVRSGFGKHLVTITAPNLASLLFHGSRLLKFTTELPSLEKVDLRISHEDRWSIYHEDTWSCCRIAALLQGIHNAKFLTLNLEFIEPLNSYMEGISFQPPFSNLKSLKIYPVDLPSDEHKKIVMTPKVINYFLDGSPSATFTLISYEEIKEKRQKAQAIANATEAQNLMANLQAMLERKKANFETELTRMPPMENREENSTDEEEIDTIDQGKQPVEKLQLQFKRRMAQMKRCSKDVGIRIDRGKRTTRSVISELRQIEVLLLKDLPTSKREELQSCFSGLCAEVDTFLKRIVHLMMIPYIHMSDCFNDLATTSLPSS
ncbi:hypothetical protein SSX86_021399 [Deinandra increscens subsp. villosa]|uniref:F-box domain-containing protein n=1 Tax=Deinandra increscens subsp. villosa TaxID=3103831 RepID=A0AAP0CU87_9ASTR